MSPMVSKSFGFPQENLRARAQYQGLRGVGNVTTFLLTDITLTDPTAAAAQILECVTQLQGDPWLRSVLLISNFLQRRALKQLRGIGCLSVQY
ncbi:unnamed protein product [Dibothriocephalus latus]|uniref:Uncharacterized protein n=1 Tax=Dibothriocephalus latus TaxID=60516 RepID=A0A3P7MND8_DIBLA|nr:unnamed protein product [Dibothriocephalus latus]